MYMYNGVALLPACMANVTTYTCICTVEVQANLLNTLKRKFRRIYVFVLYQIKNKDRNSILNNPIRHVTHFQSTLVRSLSLSLRAPKCPEGSHPWLLSAYTILEQENTHTHTVSWIIKTAIGYCYGVFNTFSLVPGPQFSLSLPQINRSQKKI